MTFIDKFETMLECASCSCRSDTEFMIFGDLNIDHMKGTTSSPFNKLDFLMSTYNFSQLINTPTRISDRSESLIDVLYTTHTESVIQHGCVHTTISDHFMVYAIRRLQSNHRDKFGQFTTSYFRSYEDFVSSDF